MKRYAKRRKEAPVFLRIANDIGRAQNDFGGLAIDSGTTHAAAALPAEYSDEFVWFSNPHETATVVVAVSLENDSEVTADPADGATLTVGTAIPPRMMVRLWMPFWHPDQTAYLIHEASEAMTLTLNLGSDS